MNPLKMESSLLLQLGGTRVPGLTRAHIQTKKVKAQSGDEQQKQGGENEEGWQILKPIPLLGQDSNAKFKIGTAIVITDAPQILKTAEPMPMLRVNSGSLKVGDVGRIIARKPKDVWAVRFAIGAYLIDGKCFKEFES